MRTIRRGVTPLQGLDGGTGETRGVAPGYGTDAPLARRNQSINRAQPIRPVNFRTNGAQPISLGHRPRNTAPRIIQALKGRNPKAADHLVDANEMVECTHPEAREEGRIAENVTEILETA